MGVLGAFSDWVGIRAVVTLDALDHGLQPDFHNLWKLYLSVDPGSNPSCAGTCIPTD